MVRIRKGCFISPKKVGFQATLSIEPRKFFESLDKENTTRYTMPYSLSHFSKLGNPSGILECKTDCAPEQSIFAREIGTEE